MASVDAIVLLKGDHRRVEKLFKRFEKTGPGHATQKQDLVDQMIGELSQHAAVEEQLFYPVARATVPGTDEMALESLEEHHIVKWVLSELEKMSPQDERFDAKVTVLIHAVRQHVTTEETDFFPRVREELGRNALRDLGAALAAARRSAPLHPHPRAPDTPPANTMVGTAARVADEVGDTLSGLAQGGVAAAGDLIAATLGRTKPRAAPTGSRTARRVATRVRSASADSVEKAVRATRAGKAGPPGGRRNRGSESSAPSASRHTTSAAKATATSGHKPVTRTATKAKRASKGTGRTGRQPGQAANPAARRSDRPAPGTAKQTARRP